MNIYDYGKSCRITATFQHKTHGAYQNMLSVDVLGVPTIEEAFSIAQSKLTPDVEVTFVYIYYYSNGNYVNSATLNWHGQLL